MYAADFGGLPGPTGSRNHSGMRDCGLSVGRSEIGSSVLQAAWARMVRAIEVRAKCCGGGHRPQCCQAPQCK